MSNVVSNTAQSIKQSISHDYTLFPWWQWIILIFVIALATCFVVWFIIRITKGKVKIGNLEISGSQTDGKQNDEKKIRKLRCNTCSEKGDLSFAIKSIIDLTIKEHDLMTRGILASQMMKAEEHILTLKNECLMRFSNELGKRLIEKGDKTPPIHHNDYLYYKLVLQEFTIRMKELIRAACINNGFSEMTASEFNNYINDMVGKTKTRALSFFEENYIGGDILTADEVREMPILTDFLPSYLRFIFDDLKVRYEEKKEEQRDLTSKRRNIIEGKLGLDNIM